MTLINSRIAMKRQTIASKKAVWMRGKASSRLQEQALCPNLTTSAFEAVSYFFHFCQTVAISWAA